MEIQDGKGNILEMESLWATIKQCFCKHNWMPMGGVYSCSKCLYTVSGNKLSNINPLDDLFSAIAYHKNHGIVIDNIQIKESKFNALLGSTNCKNEEELRKLYFGKYGKELHKIVLLEG